MARLFMSSEVFVPDHPEQHGFYDLELPDAFRWMKQEARCLLPADKLVKFASPTLRITANGAHRERFLSVSVGAEFIGTQHIDRFGSYYFQVSPERLPITGNIEISLRVDRAAPVGSDPRTLGLPIYGIDIIDLDSGWDGFDERRYLADQIKVFSTSESTLVTLLDNCGLSHDSLILDVGAGNGWGTVLLAARTGARVFGVDLHQYDSNTGESTRSELLRRVKRHLSPLMQEFGFERFAQPEQVIDHCTFVTMDVHQLLFRDNLFDFVFSLNTFNHIADPERALHEISRVLKPGGYVFLQFNRLYFSDDGHHLSALTDIPWIHLLHDRSEIKNIIVGSGKSANEVDRILDTLNGYHVSQYFDIFDQSGLKMLERHVHRGFSFPGSEGSEEFIKLKAIYPEEDLTTSRITVVLRKLSRASGNTMIVKPFDFKRRQGESSSFLGALRKRRRHKQLKFIVPDWFKKHWCPDTATIEFWTQQYELAKHSKEHQLPDQRMRMPSDELHQLMAKEFWQEVPKDFDNILDIGCSDGYMVKIFQDAGKDAVGINDFLYPTDTLFIEEHHLNVYEMDMHCMDFEDESFDAVWCRHTLEHSFAPLQVLAEIYRITKTNGYLFAVLPPPPEPPEPYDGHWHQIPPYQFQYLLEICNFKVITMKTTYFSYQRHNDNLEIRAICKKMATGEH